MKVFVTGSTGLVGTATVKDLLANGHSVTALARSDASEKKLKDLGVQEVVRGSTLSLDVLKKAASESDAVIHLAFDHEMAFGGDPSGFVTAVDQDVAAIHAMGDGLAATTTEASPKTLMYSSGTFTVLSQDENSEQLRMDHLPRHKSEDAILSYKDKGVRTIMVRLPPIVYGPEAMHPFVAMQIEPSKKAGFVAYIDEGKNEWPVTHVDDLATLLRLGLSKGESGKTFHGVDKEGIPTKDIAEYIGKRLKLPTKSISKDEAGPHYQNMLANIMPLGGRKTAKLTKEWTGWKPSKHGLFEQMDQTYKF